MHIKVITPLGLVESADTDDSTVERTADFIESVLRAETRFLTVETIKGKVILGGELLKNSVIQIVP